LWRKFNFDSYLSNVTPVSHEPQIEHYKFSKKKKKGSLYKALTYDKI